MNYLFEDNREDYIVIKRNTKKSELRKKNNKAYTAKSKKNERDEFGYIEGRILPMLPKGFTITERRSLRKKEKALFDRKEITIDI